MVRQIRSFVKRAGRMSERQKLALARAWPQFAVEPVPGQRLDFDALFPKPGRRVIEIGYGMGHSLIEMALAHPENSYLGIEVHQPGIGAILADIVEHKLTNLRLIDADATEVLKHSIEPNSLDIVQIFFPDPWPKKRHHKRRLINPEFVAILAGCLTDGGELHLATDWEAYAEQMMSVLSANENFVNTAGVGCFYHNESRRPTTKFERRGQRLGHDSWDLLFRKQTDHDAKGVA